MNPHANQTGWVYGDELTGTVVRIVADRGFCFVTTGKDDYFLHRGDYEGNFDDLRAQQTVRFIPAQTPKGLRACSASRAR